jgi:hypothetical protein
MTLQRHHTLKKNTSLATAVNSFPAALTIFDVELPQHRFTLLS